MGNETEIDLNMSEESNLSSIDNPEEKIKGVLDEKDYIPPIEDAGERAAETSGPDLPLPLEDELDPGMPFDGNSPSLENTEIQSETENPLMEEDDQSADVAAASRSTQDQPAGNRHQKKDGPAADQEAHDVTSPSAGKAEDSSTANAIAKTGKVGEQAAEMSPPIETAKGSSAAQESCRQIKSRSSINWISRMAVIVLIAIGAVFYINPFLIGLNKSQPSTKSLSGVTT